jgi:hypothetical protein
MRCIIPTKRAVAFVTFACLFIVIYNAVTFHRHIEESTSPTYIQLLPPRSATVVDKLAVPNKHAAILRVPRTSTFAPTFGYRNNSSFEDLSSVDYYACCGLGHRLIRMAAAYFVAQQLQFSFRAFWGWCGQIEAFSYLFRPYHASELGYVTSYHRILPIYTDVKPGFQPLRRGNFTLDPSKCTCRKDEIESDLELYSSLRERFRGASRVDEFVQKHFRNATVLGIHVRAGNGETGDFLDKHRGIPNPQQWVQQVANQIQHFLSKTQPKDPPILFIATDTSSMISLFRNELQLHNDLSKWVIPVLDFPQQRLNEGEGVLYGGKPHPELEKEGGVCLRAWMDALTDMFILSHADVVIAGKPSTFIQSVPLSLALAQTHPKLSQTYCEVQPILDDNTVEIDQTFDCFSNYIEWCCNAPRRSKEMLIVWDPETPRARLTLRLRSRTANCARPPRNALRFTRYCLPHAW